MLNEGQLLAHFRVVRLLGEGGMGQVYLAEDQKLHRQVALKILTSEVFGDSERLERFHREARTAAQISHANVMAIYDIGVAKDPASDRDLEYIVMEYIKGKSLSEYLKARPGDLAAVTRIAEKIASGLAAAHKMNVVHRDIKADNVMVDDDEQPKILDFGLAKPMEPLQFSGTDAGTKTVSQELTRAGKILGTVSYMSPEQVRGETLDTRSDIFSFGVLLYRMATGEFPFAAQTQVSTLAKILETRHEPPRVKNDAIPPEMERIIDKCLQKDANDRYQDTRDLVVDLRNLRRQYDSGITDRVTAQVTTPVEKPRHLSNFMRQLTWKQVALIVIIAGLVIGLIEDFAGKGSSDSGSQVTAGENSLAILSFENKTGDPALDWLQTGLPEILLTDLAQDKSVNLISRQRLQDYIGDNAENAGSAKSREQWMDAAKELGATKVLSGSYYKVGPKMRIDARLEDITSGKVLQGEKVVGDDPFMLVDSLTDKLATALNLEHAGAGEQSVTTYTSSSPEAYKIYLEGMNKFGIQVYDDAIADFEKAIKIDSTFALPYMRIGMANAFKGRQKQAADYFELAKRYQSKLPVHERTLLDIYVDLWLNHKFNDAFAKMEAMVKTYPDDLEARCIYAVLINEFTKDTVKAFAQLDTIIKANPRYQLMLAYRSQAYLGLGLYRQAVEIANRVRQVSPQSPSAYFLLASAYISLGQSDSAIAAYEDLLKINPANADACLGLSNQYIRKRDFDASRRSLEQYRKLSGKDPYALDAYYNAKSDLELWSGRFKTALDELNARLKLVLQTGDSLRIAQAYDDIGDLYYSLGRNDSTLWYFVRGRKWAPTNRLSLYPMMLVRIDPRNADTARPIMKAELKELKARTPSDFWPIFDTWDTLFEALAAKDTARLIVGIREMIKNPQSEPVARKRELGCLLVRHGEYAEGKQILDEYLANPQQTTSGFDMPVTYYMLGVANEGLGNKSEAVKNFSEMLKYWANPDTEIKEIKDARARLARLTG
jgi:serine/threonine protein kinase/tetratricopeptide (TPR) repeat protein